MHQDLSPVIMTLGPDGGGMDIVYIRDLKIDTIIGVNDWEREVRQTVSLDLEMATDVTGAADSDDLTDTVDYKAVAKRVIAFVEGTEFLLVERMAERVSDLVCREFGVKWLRLRVSKPGAVTGAADVGVVIERGEHR